MNTRNSSTEKVTASEPELRVKCVLPQFRGDKFPLSVFLSWLVCQIKIA